MAAMLAGVYNNGSHNSAILIIVALYLTFSPVESTSNDGIQSRYFVPALLPIFVSIVMLFSYRGKNASASEIMYCKGYSKSAEIGIPFIALLAVYFLFALMSYSVWL